MRRPRFVPLAATIAAVEAAVAADTLTIKSVTYGGPCGFLRGGQVNQNMDDWPVAFLSLAGFVQYWSNAGCFLNVPIPGHTTDYGPFSGSPPGVNWSQAVAVLSFSSSGDPYFVLYMSPYQVASWGLLTFQQLGITMCNNLGPIIPADSAIAQGAQYIAVMPDTTKFPCFQSCIVAPPPIWGQANVSGSFLTPLPM